MAEVQAGEVVSLRICVGSREPMKVVEEITVIKDEGIEGDRHRRASINQQYSDAASVSARAQSQVLLMDRETLGKFDLTDGLIRENVTVEGLRFLEIKQGDRLQLGEEVILEITGLCDPCGRMDEIRDGLKDELEGQRGLLAYSESGGVVKVGDRIKSL